MKFQLLSSLFLSFLLVSAQEEFDVEDESALQLTQFSIKPAFVGFDPSKTPDLVNGQEATVNFTVTNGEDFPVQIAVFGGSFVYPGADTAYANLDRTPISDLTVEANSVKWFVRSIKPTLPPTDFDLHFSFIVGYENRFVTVPVPPVSVTISDPPISAWDPKLLFVQVILGGVVMALGYYLSNTYVLPYFVDPAERKKATTVTKKNESNANTQGYDESWIPKHHLTGVSKKSRKTH
ncbi:hypothetical protein D0Z03_000978 [Geotrichum reessii]|nr:hypothetical protein D0Z03_000978 [Galactomyces reessii]